MYTSVVFVTHFDKLRRKLALAENRDISIREVSRKTGIAYTTLRRFADRPDTVTMATLAALCDFFGVRTLTELIEWKPDPPAAGSGE